jgi:hypothetical protein
MTIKIMTDKSLHSHILYRFKCALIEATLWDITHECIIPTIEAYCLYATLYRACLESYQDDSFEVEICDIDIYLNRKTWEFKVTSLDFRQVNYPDAKSINRQLKQFGCEDNYIFTIRNDGNGQYYQFSLPE